jgi:hypothetical protein
MVAIEFQISNDEKVLFRSSDYSGYELCWQRLQKEELTWTPEKYFASIEQALQKIMELKVRATEVRSLKELKVTIENARREIVEAWQIKPDIAR